MLLEDVINRFSTEQADRTAGEWAWLLGFVNGKYCNQEDESVLQTAESHLGLALLGMYTLTVGFWIQISCFAPKVRVRIV